MSSASIDSTLLQSLLSLDAVERQNAEARLQALTVEQRMGAFLQSLQQETNASLLHLVAVLLRRDILHVTDTPLLQSLVEPLLHVFLNVPRCQTAMGHCLAEVAAVLQGLTDGAASSLPTTTVQQILRQSPVAAKVMEGDVGSLELMLALADRAPQAFVHVALPGLPTLVPALVQQIETLMPTDEEDDDDMDEYEAENQQEKQRAKLYDIAHHLVVSSALAVTASENATTKENGNTHSTSQVLLNLAISCFLPLLSQVTRPPQPPPVQHWMQAAASPSTCADLFLSDPNVTQALVQTCVACAKDTNVDRVSMVLQAIHVLRYLLGSAKQSTMDSSQLLQILIPRLLEILESELDGDVDGWAMQPVPPAANASDPSKTFGDDDGQASYACELLEDLIHLDPTRALTQILLPLLEPLLTGSSGSANQSWTRPWVALVSIQAAAQAAPVSFEPHLPTALQATLQLLAANASQPNPRLQYQALQVIAVLCEARNGPDAAVVWNHVAQPLLQAIVQPLLMPTTVPRVQAMAATALVAFCRPGLKNEGPASENGTAANYVVPYLSDLLTALVQGPLRTAEDGPSPALQYRAVQAVMALAHSSGPQFAPYYTQVAHVLLAIVQQQRSTSDFETLQLQTTAVEAITVLGQSLEDKAQQQELFVPHACVIVEQWILPVLTGQNGADLALLNVGQLLSACARIASVMGGDYQPYAQSVVPHLLERIQTPTNVDIQEVQGLGLEATENALTSSKPAGVEEERVTVAVPGRGLTQVSINTTKIQEKEEAIRGLYEHAVALEAGLPLQRECLEALVPLLSYRFAADVRATAAQSIAAVYEAAVCRSEETSVTEEAINSLPLILDRLSDQVTKEEEMDALFAIADALSEVLYNLYRRRNQATGMKLVSTINFDHAKAMTQRCLQSGLVPCLERRAKIASLLSQPKYLSPDEIQQHREFLEREQKLLTPLVDSIGYVLKLLRNGYFPIFQDDVAPVLSPCLQAGTHDVRARVAAVCLFDDCVEFCGSAAATQVAPTLVQGIVAALDQNSEIEDDLKRAAFYGIAQLARHAPQDATFVANGERLVSVTSAYVASNSTAPNPPALFEDAVAALASMILFTPAPFGERGFIPRETALSLVLQNLPLSEDYDQAQICHDGLCDLVDQGILGNSESVCSEVVRIAAHVFHLVYNEDEEVAGADTCKRLARILQSWKIELSIAGVVNQVYESLPPDHKQAIESAVQLFPL